MTRNTKGRNAASTSSAQPKKQWANGGTRNRASPARIVKLYSEMTPQQHTLVQNVGFGGLLSIGSATLKADITRWLVKNFETEESHMIIPGRGKIAVNAESVQRILGLPAGETKVQYELDGSAINFINSKYGFREGKAPTITQIADTIKGSKAADEDYLRLWLMLAVHTFLCPTTSLSISSRCYPPLIDLSKITSLNWCQFVVDSFKKSVQKMQKRNSVQGCLLYIVVLYLDSLSVTNLDIPDSLPRISVWNKRLINKVLRLDTYADGSFGKLRLKSNGNSVVEESILGGIQEIHRFVASKISPNMNAQKKRKISEAVSKVCFGVTELMGNFICEVSKVMDDDSPSADEEQHVDPESNDTRRGSDRQGRNIESDDILDDADFLADEEDDEEDDWDGDGYQSVEEEEEEENEESEEHAFEEEEDQGQEVEEQEVEELNVLMRGSTSVGVRIASENAQGGESTSDMQPAPLQVVAPKQTDRQDAHAAARGRRGRLRLPVPVPAHTEEEAPSVSVSDCRLDFSPPAFNLMNDLEENHAPSPAVPEQTAAHVSVGEINPLNDEFFEGLTAGDWEKFDDEAMKRYHQKIICEGDPAQRDRVIRVDSQGTHANTTIHIAASDKGKRWVGISMSEVATGSVQGPIIEGQLVQPSSTHAPHTTPSTSGTPAFQLGPRRPTRPAAVLRSPYINYEAKLNFRPSRFVNAAYDAVCKALSGPQGQAKAQLKM